MSDSMIFLISWHLFSNLIGILIFFLEFDTTHWNISERARDAEDFLRMAYSYPNVDAIIMWQVKDLLFYI